MTSPKSDSIPRVLKGGGSSVKTAPPRVGHPQGGCPFDDIHILSYLKIKERHTWNIAGLLEVKLSITSAYRRLVGNLEFS